MKNDNWLNCSKRLRTLQKQQGAFCFTSDSLQAMRCWYKFCCLRGEGSNGGRDLQVLQVKALISCSAELQKMNKEGNMKPQWKNASGQGRHCQGHGQPLGSLLLCQQHQARFASGHNPSLASLCTGFTEMWRDERHSKASYRLQEPGQSTKLMHFQNIPFHPFPYQSN